MLPYWFYSHLSDSGDLLPLVFVHCRAKPGNNFTYQCRRRQIERGRRLDLSEFLDKKKKPEKKQTKKTKGFSLRLRTWKTLQKGGRGGPPRPPPGFRLVYILTFILKTTKPIVIYIYRMRGLYIVKFMTLSPLGLHKPSQVCKTF